MKKLIAIAALLCGTAHAEFYTGNDLLKDFNGDLAGKMLGIGYVMGVYDTTQGVVHCPPNNVTAGQVQDMVKAQLDARPDLRHLSADSHVTYVLKRAWPCKKGASL